MIYVLGLLIVNVQICFYLCKQLLDKVAKMRVGVFLEVIEVSKIISLAQRCLATTYLIA